MDSPFEYKIVRVIFPCEMGLKTYKPREKIPTQVKWQKFCRVIKLYVNNDVNAWLKTKWRLCLQFVKVKVKLVYQT